MATRTDSQSTPLVVHGSRALTLPKPSKRYEANRTCIHPGCETVLSSYNAYDTCFNHTFPWNARKTASARRTRKKPVLTEVAAPVPMPQPEPSAPEFSEDSRIAS